MRKIGFRFLAAVAAIVAMVSCFEKVPGESLEDVTGTPEIARGYGRTLGNLHFLLKNSWVSSAFFRISSRNSSKDANFLSGRRNL